MYNIFSGSSRGPDIFGTEPWHFYFRNLSLNFNLWFLLAAAAGPLVGAELLLRNRTSAKRTSIRSLVFVSPFYLWLTIFSVQPHKEERFMYPIYPLLSLNAAIALHTLLSYFGTADPRTLMGKIPAKIKLAVVSTFIISAIGVGTLRTIGIVAAYRAPLQVYAPLRRPEFIGSEQTICLGKEWYRFPSSYFLPSGMRAKFVKSAFDGLLPGEFSEAKVGFGFFPGSWLDPSGMNDQNVEDPGKYVSASPIPIHLQSFALLMMSRPISITVPFLWTPIFLEPRPLPLNQITSWTRTHGKNCNVVISLTHGIRIYWAEPCGSQMWT